MLLSSIKVWIKKDTPKNSVKTRYLELKESTEQRKTEQQPNQQNSESDTILKKENSIPIIATNWIEWLQNKMELLYGKWS